MPLSFPKHPWRVVGYCAILVIVIALGLLIFYVANERRLKHKYEAALERLQIGDSEQTVVALMGQPDEHNWCYPLPTDGDSAEQKRFHGECVVNYTYVTFLENYFVSLDRNNRVSGKWKSVSP